MNTATLKAIVCGYEKSGTTLLNEILRRHPALDSGFECGILFGNSPREFRKYQPYCAFFRKTWQLQKEDLRYICATDDWDECYRRARERSPLIVDKSVYLFDKTPGYMRVLPSVLAKVPGVPCVVSVRDPRALMLSWANWSGFSDDPEVWLLENFEQNLERFLSYARGYAQARELYPQRLFLSQFEQLCSEPEAQLQAIFQFIGMEFRPEYMNFSSQHFVYGNRVSTEYLYPYRGKLSEQTCSRILDATAEYSAWHYHG